MMEIAGFSLRRRQLSHRLHEFSRRLCGFSHRLRGFSHRLRVLLRGLRHPATTRLRGPALPAVWALVVAAMLSGVVRAQPQAAPAAERANLMSLNASAAVEVMMDTLSVTLAAVREGPDATVVQAQLKQAIEAALNEARPLAVPGQLEVQTGTFSLSPRYAPPPVRPSAAAPAIVGWSGRAEITLEGRDLQAVARVAGRLTSVSVARVSYSLSRAARERAEAEATSEAITRFRARAQGYAQQFGFSGFTIREVQVGLQEPPVFMAARAPMVRAAAVGTDEPLPVEAGKTSVSASVSGSVQMTR